MNGSLQADSSAIIEAFNPVDHGTKALAESIFGGANRRARQRHTSTPLGGKPPVLSLLYAFYMHACMHACMHA